MYFTIHATPAKLFRLKVDQKPPPQGKKGKRKIIAQPLSLNLHSVRLHFVESITGIEEIPAVDLALSEEEEQPLTDIRFRVSVRGWNNKTHQSRTQTLLDKTDTRIATTLHGDKDIILIPRDWCPDKVGSLEPEDLGWWYTINEPVKFRVCRFCMERRGDDLDKETRTIHSKECKGCSEPTKKGSKWATGKEKQPTTKRTQSQVVNQREPRTRSQQVHYNFSNDEEGLHDADDEIQGYLCVSTDPRRSESAEGGENFIITSKELRMSLQVQCEVEDQTVWMTMEQTGFPTTAAEGELDNDLDRQRGKPTVRCLHPVISAYILQRQQELSMQDQTPSMTESRTLELESEWGTQETRREDSDRDTDTDEYTTWEPNPLPLMVKHPPRVTASNTKMPPDRQGFLSQTCPKGENDLGWVQVQQKSLLCQEKIEGSLTLTHEGLTTMTHSSRTGWTIMSGTWNHLRKVWGPTAKIQDSCKTEESLEEANVFSPTRHLVGNTRFEHGLPMGHYGQ